MAVVAIETYLITSMLPMKQRTQVTINSLITVGYLCAMIFGLAFAYFGHNWVFHGLYIAGLSLVFFAGVMLAVGAVALAQGIPRAQIRPTRIPAAA